ncbi:MULTISPECIES: hypothetical protein [Bacillus cereus group]
MFQKLSITVFPRNDDNFTNSPVSSDKLKPGACCSFSKPTENVEILYLSL